MRRLFLKLLVLVLLLSCAPGRLPSLSVLVRACLCCSLRGVVHTVVGNLQCLGSFSHGISFISQNRTVEFQKKVLMLQMLNKLTGRPVLQLL